MVVVVLGFFLVRQRSGRPRFESQDYYKTYRRTEKNTYRNASSFSSSSSSSSYRDEASMMQQRKEQRTMVAVIIAVAVAAIAISLVFGLFEALLILFLLPVIVRLVRTRSDQRRRTQQDESHSY